MSGVCAGRRSVSWRLFMVSRWPREAYWAPRAVCWCSLMGSIGSGRFSGVLGRYIRLRAGEDPSSGRAGGVRGDTCWRAGRGTMRRGSPDQAILLRAVLV